MKSTIHPSLQTWLKLLFVLFYVIVITRSSWLNDDAYITFRTVDNVVQGYGLTWNTDERVQAYTHPLWMFTLSAVYAVTGEIFYTAQWLSIGISAVTALLLAFKVAKRWETAVLTLLALTLSKAYTDYSTSGLENPLTHLLLVIFLWRYFLLFNPHCPLPTAHCTVFSEKEVRVVSFLAALGILNRMDTALIFLPMVAYVVWRAASSLLRALRLCGKSLFAGFLPFIVWEVFSIIYYGFPFPNTAYAKAFDTGVPATTLAQQGLLYFLNSLKWDPITLVVILGGLLVTGYRLFRASPFKFQVSLLAPPSLGILFYLLYILKIGGDFMSGRFLAAPLLVSAILLIQYSAFNIPRWQWGTAVSLILLLGLASRHPTPFNNPSYGSRPEHEADIRDGDIADERMYYYPYTGLLNSNRQLHPWAEQGMDIRVNGPAVLEHGNIGFLGFYAGPLVHIVDRNGLADPLLARLPARDIQNWRIGHFRRNVPEGYTDGFWTGENHLVNPHLALYYEKLQRVVRGDLFNRQRWVEIWKLNTGQYNNWLKP